MNIFPSPADTAAVLVVSGAYVTAVAHGALGGRPKDKDAAAPERSVIPGRTRVPTTAELLQLSSGR